MNHNQLFILGCLMLMAQPVHADDLIGKLKPIIEAHHGKVTVYVKDLESGETFSHDADTVMPTASLIKMAVMAEAYSQAEEKKIDLAKMLTLTKEDKVQGAGILTIHFSEGASFSIRDALRLMIVYSDNTATNMVLDQIGIQNVNDRMEKLGFKNTKINAKVFKGSTTSVDPERTKKWGLGSTTAKETVELLELIHLGKVASPGACKQMMEHLKANEDKEMMVRYLPAGIVVAHKTGAVNASRTEAGIMWVPTKGDKKKTRPVALCVMTNENKDQKWTIENEGQVTIAKIAKEVYEHYSQK